MTFVQIAGFGSVMHTVCKGCNLAAGALINYTTPTCLPVTGSSHGLDLCAALRPPGAPSNFWVFN